MDYIIIFVIFLFVLIIYYIISIEQKESFNSMSLPDNWGINIPRIQDDNQLKPWAKIPDGYNATQISETPKQTQLESSDTIIVLAKYPIIETILKSMKSDVDINQYQQKKISHFELTNLNKMVWKQRLNNFLSFYQISKFPTLKSCYPGLNNALKSFLKEFNKKYNSHPSELAVPSYFGKKGFDILQYRILSVWEDGDKQVYKIVIVIFKQNAITGIHIYLELDESGKVLSYDIVGYQTTDKLLTFPGKKTISNDFYETIKLFEKGSQTGMPIMTDSDFEIYYNNHYYNKSNRLEHTYACFNAEEPFFKLTRGTEQNIIIPTYNKFECESNYNTVGQRKVRGYWDRKCLNDDECPFNGANKNYPNKRGACNRMTGYCELPEGLQHMGYRNYINPEKYTEYKPLCYNCKSTKNWKALTKLGQCCDDQKDKSKYPFLESPDYVFEQDIAPRMQAKEQNDFNINYKKYLANE